MLRQPRATVKPAIFRQTRAPGNPTPPLWLRPVTQARRPTICIAPRPTLGPRPLTGTVTLRPTDQRKQTFFQSLRAGCSRDKFTCTLTGIDLAMTGVDLAMTVTDFVRAGQEMKLYNDRIEAERAEEERRRQQAIADQEVFLDKFRAIQQGPQATDNVDCK